MRRPGWRWFDPSNYIYAIGWWVVLLQAEHSKQPCAIQLHVSMIAMMRRWPRDWAGKHGIEGLGDFWEWLLAIGYYDVNFEGIIFELSPLFDAILSLEHWLQRECNMTSWEGESDYRLPWRNPKDAAKMILLAHKFQIKKIALSSLAAKKYHECARVFNYYYF